MPSCLHFFSDRLLRGLPEGGGDAALPTLPGVAAALAGAALARQAPSRLALVVAPGPAELERVYGDFCGLGPESGVKAAAFRQPMACDPEAAGSRLIAIRMLHAADPEASDEPRVMVTSLEALLQAAPDPDAVARLSVNLRVGLVVSLEDVVARLVAGGYERVTDVEAPGQMAARGGVLDLWPPPSDGPWRAEFDGDQVESLRRFDPATQCSTGAGESVWLPPCSEAGSGERSLVDLLPAASAILWLDHDRMREGWDSDAERGPDGSRAWRQLLARVAARNPWRQLFSGDPAPPGVPSAVLAIEALPGFADLGGAETRHPEWMAGARRRWISHFQERAAAGETVVMYADADGACDLLARELGTATRVEVRRGAISGGFMMPGLAVSAQADLYGARRQAPRRTFSGSTRVGARVEQAEDLNPGDLVVHVDHGIGRFLGSAEIEMDGRRLEVFSLAYDGGAKLHVPATHAHLLSRYVGVAGHKARLHRLGGRRWTREKGEAERAVADLAASLLETQAHRQVVAGFACDPDPPWMQEFEAAFPYQETPDQTRVIAEIKRDLAAPRPMDRLVCGDAGYGKTEVAMRAAFIAVMNGRQVAVLVPTTVLAEQHVETFRARLAAYPIRIEVVSRFHSVARRARILAAAREGQADIVIGTHALLSEGVSFRNLGLLVIDEEQRFGVAHKERLKQARAVVDVLTLTATPIPRTLYMSMTGARDMSLLQTPPRERVAVETLVARDADETIRRAIAQEAKRGGQVYFLYNRVATIGLMRRRLARLAPGLRIETAHGQMSSSDLARVMRAFEAGEVDVLLCTTIVESGLDIPRANTILIHRADRFGIADLCQLRGRVGRSSLQGFAWLLLPEYGVMDDAARRRIAALQKYSGLGSGFNLALRDLEIRGAGNLLGAAQSGHIAAVGFGLYCQLLRRTIARLKGEKQPLLVDVDLALDFLDFFPGASDPETAACLPYAYVEDEAHRLALHRRLAEAGSVAEIQALSEELTDRFGRPPVAARRFLKVAELRILAARKRLGRIETVEGKIHLYRRKERAPTLVKGRLPRLRGQDAEQRLQSLCRVVERLAPLA